MRRLDSRDPSATNSPARLVLDGVDSRSAGSLHDFIRRVPGQYGGACTRDQILEAILTDPQAAPRLQYSKGLASILSNMKHSGFVVIEGQVVRRTARHYGRKQV